MAATGAGGLDGHQPRSVRRCPPGSALGTITNVGNTAIETPAVTFAFLDAEGNVVTTQTVSGATLQMGAEMTFNVAATGAGIVAWRYTVGSSGV